MLVFLETVRLNTITLIFYQLLSRCFHRHLIVVVGVGVMSLLLASCLRWQRLFVVVVVGFLLSFSTSSCQRLVVVVTELSTAASVSLLVADFFGLVASLVLVLSEFCSRRWQCAVVIVSSVPSVGSFFSDSAPRRSCRSWCLVGAVCVSLSLAASLFRFCHRLFVVVVGDLPSSLASSRRCYFFVVGSGVPFCGCLFCLLRLIVVVIVGNLSSSLGLLSLAASGCFCCRQLLVVGGVLLFFRRRRRSRLWKS